jgi:hypothetical protein
VETTELDGTIESAISSLLQPEEVEEVVEEDTEEAAELEDSEEEPEGEDAEEEEVEEEDDEDADEAEESTPELYTVKVDGKEEQVSLDDLKRGYSGQQYVQKGMQEAANLRKQAELVYQALMNERAMVAQAIQGGIPQPPAEPSKDMFESDPIGFMEAKLKYDDQLKEYNERMGQFQQIAEQQGQAQQAAQRAYLEREMETLKQVVPEFADPQKASQVRDRLVTMGQEIYGYEPNEISAVMDHRAIRVLNDAIKYQELMSGKKQAERKAKPKPKRTVRAGAKKTASNANAERQTRQKLKKSGNINDALSLILNER